jgi:hypothetical protein
VYGLPVPANSKCQLPRSRIRISSSRICRVKGGRYGLPGVAWPNQVISSGLDCSLRSLSFQQLTATCVRRIFATHFGGGCFEQSGSPATGENPAFLFSLLFSIPPIHLLVDNPTKKADLVLIPVSCLRSCYLSEGDPQQNFDLVLRRLQQAVKSGGSEGAKISESP